jgi:polyhydroxybutyrate depolymerase
MTSLKILSCSAALGLLACSGTTSPVNTGSGSSGGTTTGGGTSGGTSGGLPDAGHADGGLVAARPYHLQVPTGYNPTQPTPLLILLHGYGASGAIEESYFKFGPLAESQTVLYATPDGTLDPIGARFWNATDACCDLFLINVDDVAYLSAVIDDVESQYNVDPKRIYVVGHSNGGFMAHRLACDLSSRIAAIVSLAGAQWETISRCAATEKVAVLEVHGTADGVIAYDGGNIGGHAYPAAPQTVSDWATLNGCGNINTSAPNLDLESSIPGPETSVASYDGCAGGAAVLWTINGGAHVPSLQPIWPNLVFGFLLAHPKP